MRVHTDGEQRYDVFVAYAQPDVAWVRVLAGRLDQAGFKIYFDHHGAELRLAIEPGEDLADVPWETPVPEGTDRPLAPTPDVQPYRAIDTATTVLLLTFPVPCESCHSR